MCGENNQNQKIFKTDNSYKIVVPCPYIPTHQGTLFYSQLTSLQRRYCIFLGQGDINYPLFSFLLVPPFLFFSNLNVKQKGSITLPISNAEFGVIVISLYVAGLSYKDLLYYAGRV